MRTTATAAEARQYFRDDNGWTDKELDLFFEEYGTQERTHAEWYDAIYKFIADHPNLD